MMMRHPIISLQARALMFTLTILTLVNAFLGRWPGHPDRRYDVLILLKSTLDTNGYGSIADRVPVSDTSAWTSTGLGLQEGVVAVVLVLLVIIDLWARRTRRLPSISTRTTSEQLQNLETMPTTVSGSEPGRRVNPLTARIIAGVRGESAEVDQSELESGLALMSETQPAPQPVTPTTYVRAEPMSGGRLPPSTLGDSDPEPMSMLAPPGVLPPAPDLQPVPRIDPPPVAVGGVVRTATGGRIEIDLGEVIAPQQPGPSGGRLAPPPMESVERERIALPGGTPTPVPEAPRRALPSLPDLPEDEPEPVRRLAPMPEPEVVAEPPRRRALPTALPDLPDVDDLF